MFEFSRRLETLKKHTEPCHYIIPFDAVILNHINAVTAISARTRSNSPQSHWCDSMGNLVLLAQYSVPHNISCEEKKSNRNTLLLPFCFFARALLEWAARVIWFNARMFSTVAQIQQVFGSTTLETVCHSHFSKNNDHSLHHKTVSFIIISKL